MLAEHKHLQLSSNAKKLAAAIVLGLVLLTILLFPNGHSRSSSRSNTASACEGNAPATNTPVQASPTPPSSNPLNSSNPVELPLLPLPQVVLADIVSQDPFRTRNEARKSHESERAIASKVAEKYPTEPTNINSQKDVPIELAISGIATGSSGSTVLIGGELYRERDILVGGWQIVAIKTNSILVSKTAETQEVTN